MKELTKLRIKNFFAGILPSIKLFFVFIGYWFTGMWKAFISSRDTFFLFEGWGHFWMAKHYADKRNKRSRPNKYCGGKFFYVLPWSDYSLCVISSEEIQRLRKKKLLNSNFNIKEVLKSAYYVATGNNNSKTK